MGATKRALDKEIGVTRTVGASRTHFEVTHEEGGPCTRVLARKTSWRYTHVIKTRQTNVIQQCFALLSNLTIIKY